MQKKSNKTKVFLYLTLVLAYLYLYIYKTQIFWNSVNFSLNILKKYIGIIFIIFVLMLLSNLYVKTDFIMKHLSNKGWLKWFYIIIAGLLSSGPIYLWYPLLADLKKKGLSDGLIACFLYNRAIKIPLLSIAVYYFGFTYVLILTLVMIVFSVIQGVLIDKVLNEEKL